MKKCDALHPQMVRHRPGERFGLLMVVRFVGMVRDGQYRAAAWLCRCECGRDRVVRGKNLRNGGTTSCGCKRGRRVLVRRRVRCPSLGGTP